MHGPQFRTVNGLGCTQMEEGLSDLFARGDY